MEEFMEKWKENYRISCGPTFTCDFTTNESAGNTDFHIHNQHEIYLLLEGNIQYFVENICYPISSGDLILFSNKEIHKAINTSNKPFTRLVIHVNPNYIRAFCTLTTNLLSCFHREAGTANLVCLTADEQKSLVLMATSLMQANERPEEYGNDVSSLTTLIAILILINKAWMRTSPTRNIPNPHRAQAIMNYIEKHLTEPITLDSISDALALDKYYLSHLFKRETESSIFQYILVKRVALAKKYLAEGFTVSETCHLSGFQDYSNFIRTFRQTTGLTPGQFKKLNLY